MRRLERSPEIEKVMTVNRYFLNGADRLDEPGGWRWFGAT